MNLRTLPIPARLDLYSRHTPSQPRDSPLPAMMRALLPRIKSSNDQLTLGHASLSSPDQEPRALFPAHAFPQAAEAGESVHHAWTSCEA